MGAPKEITIPYMSTAAYLKFWSGSFALTVKEILVLAAMVDTEGEIGSAENKHDAAIELEITVPVITTYIKRLKDKKAIAKNGKYYRLHGILARRETLVLHFDGPPDRVERERVGDDNLSEA